MIVDQIELDPPKQGEARVKILATGICHSDVFFYKGGEPMLTCPLIAGHESIGIVESVGPGVTSLAAGDTVLTGFHPQCRNCEWCKNPKTNLCKKIVSMKGGRMLDGTSRIKWRGKSVSALSALGTFAEYIVASEISLTKVKPVTSPQEACLLSCAIPTGYGSVVNLAKVEPGSACAVWGLGGVGLAAVLGCRDSKAATIIGVDTNPEKSQIAEKFGCTHFLNPGGESKPLHQRIAEMTNGGLDYAFVAVGNPDAMTEAFKSCHPAWGTTVAIGLGTKDAVMRVDVDTLVRGKTVKGAFMGGLTIRDDIPGYVEKYLEGKFPLNLFVTHTFALDQVNEGLEMLKNGKVIRGVIVMGK